MDGLIFLAICFLILLWHDFEGSLGGRWLVESPTARWARNNLVGAGVFPASHDLERVRLLSSMRVVLGLVLEIVVEEVQAARALIHVALFLVLQNKYLVVDRRLLGRLARCWRLALALFLRLASFDLLQVEVLSLAISRLLVLRFRLCLGLLWLLGLLFIPEERRLRRVVYQ